MSFSNNLIEAFKAVNDNINDLRQRQNRWTTYIEDKKYREILMIIILIY